MSSPYISLVITCSQCGTKKQSTNHWYICHMTDRFLIKPWDNEAVLQEDNVLPLCGDQCIMKMMQKYLSLQKSKPQGVDDDTQS